MFTLPRYGEVLKAPWWHIVDCCIILRSGVWRLRRPCIYLLLTADPLIFFILTSLLVVFIRLHRIFTRGVSLEWPCPWLCYELLLAISHLLQEDQSIPTSSTIVSNIKSTSTSPGRCCLVWWDGPVLPYLNCWLSYQPLPWACPALAHRYHVISPCTSPVNNLSFPALAHRYHATSPCT